MNELLEHGLNQNRRKFLSKMSLGLGGLGLGSLMVPGMFDGPNEADIFSKILPSKDKPEIGTGTFSRYNKSKRPKLGKLI